MPPPQLATIEEEVSLLERNWPQGKSWKAVPDNSGNLGLAGGPKKNGH